MADDLPLDPSRLGNREALREPPFWAMEVEPAITMSFRGLKINESGQTLDADNKPIAGLLAAGGDACFYHSIYFGGLSMSLVFGLRAAQTALGQV